MPHADRTYHSLRYHLVFATKDREPLLFDPVMEQARRVMQALADERGGELHAAHGSLDHLHLLVTLPPQAMVGAVARRLKATSARMVPGLAWQDGYAAFTVDDASFDRLLRFIGNQPTHHRRLSFLTEMRLLVPEESRAGRRPCGGTCLPCACGHNDTEKAG